jgi:prepilin-type N-terminal cleavage/methylation domain-containing protein
VTGAAAARTVGAVRAGRSVRAGLTLVEVLVATALFGLFAAVSMAGLVTALRLQAEATTLAARTAAFEPLLLVGGAVLDAVPSCGAAASAPDAAPESATASAPVVCRRSDERCRLFAGVLACDGGPLRRVRLAIAGDPVDMPAWEVVTWSRAVP